MKSGHLVVLETSRENENIIFSFGCVGIVSD